jgi:hypothetical protein
MEYYVEDDEDQDWMVLVQEFLGQPSPSLEEWQHEVESIESIYTMDDSAIAFLYYRDWRLDHDPLLSRVFETYEEYIQYGPYNPEEMLEWMTKVEHKIVEDFETVVYGNVLS